MVTFCEVHRRFYVRSRDRGDDFSSVLPACCDVFFERKPMFTNVGTCYTSKTDVVENYASISSTLKVWVNFNKEDSPGTELRI